MVTCSRRSTALLIVALSASLTATAVGDTRIADVPVGADPFDVAVHAGTGRVYVSNTTSDDVSVVDGATRAVVATVPVGSNPSAIEVSESANRVYVANRSSNSVTVIDGATHGTHTVVVGDTPTAIAVDETRGVVWVANNVSDSLTMIDSASFATATVAVGDGPVSVGLNETTNKVYVANSLANTVSVVDGATRAVTTVPAGTEPIAIAVDEQRNRAFVPSFSSKSVTVIDGAASAATTIAVGSNPVDVAVDAESGRAYVANLLSDSLSVIDGGVVVGTVGVGARPISVAIDATHHKAYAVNSNGATVTVTDLVFGGQVAVETGANPRAIAIDAGRDLAFVASVGSDVVTVIDTSTAVPTSSTSSTSSTTSTSTTSTTAPPQAPSVERVAGVDRYATAAALNDDLEPGVDRVYVASGERFADALAVGPIAGAEGAGLVLVAHETIPSTTASVLRRLTPREIVVVGGTGAISPGVESALLMFADSVVRVGGADRYETAVAISQELSPGVETVHVVAGESFPDAIAAGQAAGILGGPILPVPRSGLPDVLVAELHRLAPSRIVIVGGPGAVSAEIESAIGTTAEEARVERAAGVDRYATAVELARTVADAGVVGAVLAASGVELADALAATPVAVRRGVPLVLVPRSGMVPSAVRVLLDELAPERIEVIGGSAAVSAEVAEQLRA